MSQDASDAESDEDSAGTDSEEADSDAEPTAEEKAGETDVDPELVEHVETTDAESLAREIDELRGEVESLQSEIETLEGELESREEEIDDLESRLARKQADFQNYKKRQEQRVEDIKERATEDLVERLVEVRDNLQRALDQGEDADIRGGVESTLDQFDRELDRENVAVIDPEPGEEADPTRHEVLMRVDSDLPEGTVDEVHRPGYEMAGTVLRPAQVTVSGGSADGSSDEPRDSSDESQDEENDE